MTKEEFEQFRKKAKKILGHMPMKTPCLTCRVPGEKRPKGAKLPPRWCVTRDCVDRLGIENCAYCSRFPCGHLRESEQWTREYFEEKHGKSIPDDDYHTFIEPFENLKRLEKIRASLSPEEIVEVITVPPLTVKIIPFPQKLSLSQEEKRSFKAVHQLLSSVKTSSLGVTDTDTFAQQQRLKRRIPYFLRFLWIFGRFGESKDDTIEVDAKSFMDNRKKETSLAELPYVETVIFKILPTFGVQCMFIPEKGGKKGPNTPTGYLRESGWSMTLSFDEKTGGAPALKAFQTYSTKLGKKYGKRAFNYFKNVDMRVLGDGEI
jgi:hypothetical protein